MSSLRKLAGQTALYGISSILGRFVNWGLTPLYTKHLSRGDMGVMTDLYAYTAYFLVILTFGMETAFFRYSMDKKDWKQAYDQSFIFVLMLGAGFTALALLNLGWLSGYLGQVDRQTLVMYVIITIFLDVAAALPMVRFRYEEKAKQFAMINLASIGVNVVLNFIFIVVMKKGLEYAFLAGVLASGMKLALCLPGHIPENWKMDWKSLRPMANYGFYIMLAGLLGMMTQNLEKNMIPKLWPEQGGLYHGVERTGHEMLGLYSAGYKLAMVILLATQAFRYAAEPFFFRHAKESKSRTIYARVFHYYWVVCMGVFVLVGTFAQEMAGIKLLGYQLIDKKFWEGLDVVPLLLMSYSLFGAYSNLSIWFKLTKQTRFGLLFSAIGVAIVLGLNLFLIPTMGYVGSAWVSVICFAVMGALVFVSGQKYYPIPYRLDRAAVVLCVALLGFFVARYGVESVGLKALVCIGVLAIFWVMEKLYPIHWAKGTVIPSTELPTDNPPQTPDL